MSVTLRGNLLCLFIIASLPCLAQNNQFGRIQGNITDSTGAPIAGVAVTLSSPALVVPQSAVSDGAGEYHFEQLPVGTYRIQAQQPGFQKFIRENIQISAGFTATVD